MKVTLTKEFRFEASHRLDHLPPSHPCYNLHGHSYRVLIQVHGKVDETTGFLIDYADIKRIVDPIVSRLDHTHLNNVDGLSITSTEFIARWLWERIKPNLAILSKIIIEETQSSSCEYSGE
ncbi:MAG: 6-carboxytetrahydropterin synthase QueD [candidate division Zixibacteria bacterium]|nr:6-carboxytetrahydropterin synthase QueD [candidate division Zixibacteria bacterium]